MRRVIRLFASALALSLIICVIAYGVFELGSFYINVLSKTKITRTTSAAKPESNGSILKLPGFNVWLLQFGIYSNRTGAENLVAKLQQKGIQTVVLGSNPYRVVSGYFGQQKAAHDQRLLLSLKKVSALVKVQEVNGISFKIAAGSTDQVGTLLANYGQILALSAKYFTASDPAELQEQALKDLNTQISNLYVQTDKLAATGDGSSRPIIRETAQALDKQGGKLRTEMNKFVQTGTVEDYQQVQTDLLQLLNIYWYYIDLLQGKAG